MMLTKLIKSLNFLLKLAYLGQSCNNSTVSRSSPPPSLAICVQTFFY
jgi:hypothetical protein